MSSFKNQISTVIIFPNMNFDNDHFIPKTEFDNVCLFYNQTQPQISFQNSNPIHSLIQKLNMTTIYILKFETRGGIFFKIRIWQGFVFLNMLITIIYDSSFFKKPNTTTIIFAYPNSIMMFTEAKHDCGRLFKNRTR